MEEYIVTVDGADKAVGLEEKVKCHLGAGITHRAFMVMVFDPEGRLLLARRSNEKMLWPGYWDGTVASHIHEGETYEDAALERLGYELGIDADEAKFLFKFRYTAKYKDVGVENEVCAVLAVDNVHPDDLSPNKSEVSETKYVPAENIKDMEDICPWLLIALDIMKRIEPSLFPLWDVVITPSEQVG